MENSEGVTIPSGLRTRLLSYADFEVAEHAVRWRPAAWDQPELEALAPLVGQLERSTLHGDEHLISRADVFAYRDRHALDIFGASMIWGFGPTNYGPRRVEWMLGTPGAIEKLEHAVEIFSSEGAVEAHRFMLNPPGRLAWCRTPFITKFLYFTGFGLAIPGLQPLIFDDRVRASLAESGIDIALNSTSGYEAFLELSSQWAVELELPRSDLVEVPLFRP